MKEQDAGLLEEREQHIAKQAADVASERDDVDARARELDIREAILERKEARAELVARELSNLRAGLEERDLEITHRERQLKALDLKS